MNLIRNLVALIIVLSLLPLCLLGFRYTAGIKFDYDEINDEIALCQLREILLISYDMHVSSNRLDFRYRNDDFRLSLVNEKLILQPGTQIFLNDIDDVSFKKSNGCIYVCYRKENHEYERVIAKAEGIYLDRFSDCDVRDDGDDHRQE